jgi:hypothetical protein
MLSDVSDDEGDDNNPIQYSRDAMIYEENAPLPPPIQGILALN